MGFSGGSATKKSPTLQEMWPVIQEFDPWIRKIPWRRKWQPTPVLLLLLLLSHFSRVRLCATPWTAAYQAPLSMGFARQEYWSGLPLPSPHSSIRAWKIPWTEETGRLQSVVLQKSRYMTWKLNNKNNKYSILHTYKILHIF